MGSISFTIPMFLYESRDRKSSGARIFFKISMIDSTIDYNEVTLNTMK